MASAIIPNVFVTVKMAETSADSALQDDFNQQHGNPATAAAAQQREERTKAVREKQNEERQRKLEELKQQAQATQKFREQQEEERRRRLEEQRQRDLERRNQVEERKKAILDAEKERRDAILRRNQDRDVRLEMKRRNERGSMAFAFGSSTPRMLEPVSPAPVTYWTSRRSTSTNNVMSSSMHVRTVSVDRDAPDETGAAKRASSVFALDQTSQAVPSGRVMSSSMYEVLHWDTNEDSNLLTVPSLGRSPSRSPSPRRSVHFSTVGDILMTQSTSAVLGGSGPDGRRRRTDLMPTVPAHRDATSPVGPLRPGSSRSSISHRASDGTSDELQSRSMSKSMSHLATPPKRLFASKNKITEPPKMAKSTTSMSTGHLGPAPRRKTSDGVTPAPRMTRAEKLRQQKNAASKKKDEESTKNGLRSGELTPSSPTRPLSALSHQSSISTASSLHHVRARTAPTSARKPRPMSIAGTGMSAHTSQDSIAKNKETKDKTGETPARRVSSGTITRPPRARSAEVKDPLPSKTVNKAPQKTTRAAAGGKTEKKQQNAAQPEKIENPVELIQSPVPTESVKTEQVVSLPAGDSTAEIVPEQPEKESQRPVEPEPAAPVDEIAPQAAEETQELPGKTAEVAEEEISPAKKIITSEEEAKAALAEKRRLAREQMEREAEAERLRLEAEQRAEDERRRQEELEQKLAEEEMERLAKEAQRAEEERLQKAIEETARREEEERLRREEELRQKAEKEQAERKQREEAERLRRENEERLRREEEERQERRKRVEAIMSRTRGKGGANSKSTNGVEDKNGTTNQESVPVENGSPSSINGSGAPQDDPAADYSKPDLLSDVVSESDTSQMTRSADKVELLPDVGLLTNADDVNSNSSNRIEQSDLTQLLA